jgi:ketosteroid isomerase-like protein
MSTDTEQIRTLIERWADAVHRGDMAGVLADHAEDIVMFDVPPPQQGVRGIGAYRETWPGFFAWQASGASFDLLSLEVTAGADVAFAYALLRCGTADQDPDVRLRITFGLRKEAGRWVVAHEHHSFPDRSDPADADAVRAVHERWFAATAAKDLDRIMESIAPDVVSYEHEAPLAYVGADAVRPVCRRGLEASTGTVTLDVPDLTVLTDGDLAVAWGLNRIVADGVETWSRGTRVFRRVRGEWVMSHQQVSFPYDPATGKAATDLRP